LTKNRNPLSGEIIIGRKLRAKNQVNRLRSGREGGDASMGAEPQAHVYYFSIHFGMEGRELYVTSEWGKGAIR